MKNFKLVVKCDSKKELKRVIRSIKYNWAVSSDTKGFNIENFLKVNEKKRTMVLKVDNERVLNEMIK